MVRKGWGRAEYGQWGEGGFKVTDELTIFIAVEYSTWLQSLMKQTVEKCSTLSMQMKVLVQRNDVSRVCGSCAFGTEERRRTSVGAGSQTEQCLLHRPEEQQMPRGRVCTVCHGSALEIPEQDNQQRLQQYRRCWSRGCWPQTLPWAWPHCQASSRAACESPVPAHPEGVADINRENCCMAWQCGMDGDQ